jgi:hypothetical protein
LISKSFPGVILTDPVEQVRGRGRRGRGMDGKGREGGGKGRKKGNVHAYRQLLWRHWEGG